MARFQRTELNELGAEFPGGWNRLGLILGFPPNCITCGESSTPFKLWGALFSL